MARILTIETSGKFCSVAVLEDDTVIQSFISEEEHSHAIKLPEFIQNITVSLKTENKSIDAVAVSGGPGSYTGLRIGVSCAKGICYALDIPLIAIDTLKLISYVASETINRYMTTTGLDANALICPMVDARRMEVYTATHNLLLEETTKAEPMIIDDTSFADLLEHNVIFFCGNGAAKCKSIITHPNAVFIDDIEPAASRMGFLAAKALEEKRFADIAYYEPNYLKEFQATTPKNNINL